MGASEVNEALVRRAYDAWNRNDWEALGEIYHPEIVAIAPEGFMEAGEYRGWPAVRQAYRSLKAAWEGESIEVERVVAEGDRVVARVRWFGTGRASGSPVSLEVTNLVDVSDGMIARLEYYWSFDEALAAMRRRSEAGNASAREPG